MISLEWIQTGFEMDEWTDNSELLQFRKLFTRVRNPWECCEAIRCSQRGWAGSFVERWKVVREEGEEAS